MQAAIYVVNVTVINDITISQVRQPAKLLLLMN